MTGRGRHDRRVLVLPGLAADAVWSFIALADEVREGETLEIDRRLLLALRRPDDPSDPLGGLWLEEMIRDLTAFGGVGPLVMIPLAAALYLLLRPKRPTAAFVPLALGRGHLPASLPTPGSSTARPHP